MGQILSFVIVSSRSAVRRVRDMESRRRRGPVFLPLGASSDPENSASASSISGESSREPLSRHNGRPLLGGRSDRPLCPDVVLSSRFSESPSCARMSQVEAIELDVLNREFVELSLSSEAPERVPDAAAGSCSVDCCPRCTCVPVRLRRRRAVIPLVIALSVMFGLTGLLRIYVYIFF